VFGPVVPTIVCLRHESFCHCTVGSTVRVIVAKTPTLVRFLYRTRARREDSFGSFRFFSHTQTVLAHATKSQRERRTPEKSVNQEKESAEQDHNRFCTLREFWTHHQRANQGHSTQETFFGPIARRTSFSSANLCRSPCLVFPPREGAIDRSINHPRSRILLLQQQPPPEEAEQLREPHFWIHLQLFFIPGRIPNKKRPAETRL